MNLTAGIPWQHHLYWGLGLGVAVSLCIQILTWVGLGLSHLTWILPYVLVIAFAWLATRSYEKRLGTRPGVLQTVVLLLVMILIYRCIYQMYMFVYINYVDPDWVDRVAQVWSAQLADAGTAQHKIDSNIAAFRRQWQTDYVFTLGIISYGVAQFVVACVTALVAVVKPWKKR